jgi:hypothetical protein
LRGELWYNSLATAHLEGFVRSLVVKLFAPQIQAVLIALAQTLELQTDIAMQAFVSTIVLGMTRTPPF